MTPLHPARRRAERFATLVEGGGRDDAAQAVLDAHTAELLELVDALRAAPEVQARPEFVAGLRERLMTAAETDLAPARREDAASEVTRKLTVTPRRNPRERRIAVALGALAIIGASTSMAVASQGALPGDALYPLKRAIENTHANLSVGDEAKGSTLLHNASARLDEVRAMTKDADADPGEVTSTLDAYSSQVTQGGNLLMKDYRDTGDEDSVNELRDFAATSMMRLSALEGVIPSESEDSLLNAARTTFTIDAAAGQLCPGCSSHGITEIPATLLASGTESLDQAQSDLAAAATAEANNPLLDAAGPLGETIDNGHGHHAQPGPSGLNPPQNPLTIPTQLPPVTPPSSDVTGSAGGVVSGLVDGVTGHHGNGGKTKKPTPTPTTVGEAVGGAVDGTVNTVVNDVGDLLDELLGGS